jgi:hypothetical protein
MRLRSDVFIAAQFPNGKFLNCHCIGRIRCIRHYLDGQREEEEEERLDAWTKSGKLWGTPGG